MAAHQTFTLSLSKGRARKPGFDKLSPNGTLPILLSLLKDKLNPNGGEACAC